eukprot:11302552-Alexandrium_andersonii.AAC.1
MPPRGSRAAAPGRPYRGRFAGSSRASARVAGAAPARPPSPCACTPGSRAHGGARRSPARAP